MPSIRPIQCQSTIQQNDIGDQLFDLAALGLEFSVGRSDEQPRTSEASVANPVSTADSFTPDGIRSAQFPSNLIEIK